MSTDAGNEMALLALGRLAKHYLLPGIEEVAVNRPGFVWRKQRGENWLEHEDAEISYDYLFGVCRVLANINGTVFTKADTSIVSCELPGAPFRFQAIMGEGVRYELADRRGVAIAIRSLMANTEIKFEHYGLTRGARLTSAHQQWLDFQLSAEAVDQLAQAIDNHLSVIVSGATGSGKTTFVNQVIKLIDPKARIITVEDAREVTVPHRNRIHFKVERNDGGSSKIGYNQVLDAIVRLTPEFVVCGELSTKNAQAVFSLMGKGHPVITTVHAATPEEAMRAFVNNMTGSGQNIGMTMDGTMDTLEAQIGCIVQLVQRDGKRRVSDILFPSRERHQRIEAERRKREGDAPDSPGDNPSAAASVAPVAPGTKPDPLPFVVELEA